MSSAATKTLIIKIGATGDVVRTTALLHALEGDIHWVTSGYNAAILPPNCSRLTNVFSIEQDIAAITKYQYDLVLSLDEDPAAALLLPMLGYKRLSGIFNNGKGLGYTNEAAGWFDMSLISYYGKQQADILKYQNRKTYQQLIFEIAGKTFNAQPYWINLPAVEINSVTVGIEKRVGDRWKGKIWWGYDELAAQLTARGYNVSFFTERSTLHQYMADIGSCNYIITGDTLAMHTALAFGVPTLAVFTCTAPWEIFDYGLLHKVVSHRLQESFYKAAPSPAAINAISVEQVMQAFLQLAAKDPLQHA